MPREHVQKFVSSLKERGQKTLWYRLLRFVEDDEPEGSVSDEDARLTDFDTRKCSRLLWEKNQVRKTHTAPFEIPNTKNQRRSPTWQKERAIRCTASTCKRILGLTEESAKINFLRQHVWGLDRIETYAMRYGIEHEDEAREAYLEKIRRIDPKIEVEVTGAWEHPKFPMLLCSPDGIVKSPGMIETILLEIKCLSLTHVNPAKFYETMSPEQCKSYYLKKLSDGRVALKQGHSYYSQVQMSLDILGLEQAHFFVWSKSGSVILPIYRDRSFFNEKRARLIAYHRNVLVPEYFLRRTVKGLPPVEVMYEEYHEDENDDYFLHNDL